MKCDCGQHKECVRKVNADGNGKLSVNTSEHFKCGVIKRQIRQSAELFGCYVRAKVGCHCIDTCEYSDLNKPI